MNITGGPSITGSSAVSRMTMQELVDGNDIEGTLLSFGIERAQRMEDLVKAKVADMRSRNAGISELQQAMQVIRAAKPEGKDDDTLTSASTPELAKAMATLREHGIAIPDGLSGTNNDKIVKLENAMVELNTVAPQPDKAGTKLTPLPDTAKDFPGQSRLTHEACGAIYDSGVNYHSYVSFTPTGGGAGYDSLKKDGGWKDLKGAVQGKIDTIESQPESLKGKKAAFDDLLANMQGKIDQLTSNDQLDMIQLQSMVGKQNNSIEMVSNLLNKFQGLKDKITGNMR